jgi:hypothetical protein
MDNNYKEFCLNEYNRLFGKYVLSSSFRKDEDKRREAQKRAIKETLINAISTFPDVEPSDIWKTIYVTHVYNNSKIADYEVISKVISADQSWKKSSGHAFEEMISDIANPFLVQHGIKIILQKELSILLNQNRISNQEPDIDWLRKQVKSSVFDLYLAIQDSESYKIFGCIQSKTSIRDRVTRDREPSIIAMEKFFMSVAIVLDGDFLRLPKFRNMVNGDSSEYLLNGWHGMYVLSNREIEIDRIHSIDVSMENFVKDVIEGAKFWTEQRQWFNHTWKPQR